MPTQISDTKTPSYFKKIKALGFSIVHSDRNIKTISPLRSRETWQLRMPEESWILYVNESPQILFQPEEVVKFLVHRKFPSKVHHVTSPCP